jgi:hypothetical protein
MANYCTAEEVQVLLGYPDAFSANTVPTVTQVTAEITNVTNEIDFVLAGVGITTQPSDARILGRLRNACTYGVGCRIGMSYFRNNTGVNDTQPGYYCTRYQEILDEIKGQPELYGSITGDDVTLFSSHVLDGTYSEREMNNLIIDDEFEY